MDEAQIMRKQQDIFDWIMGWKILLPLNPFYKHYKEPLLYLFFGGLCTLVNIASFWLGIKVLPPLLANIFAWVISVAFAYFTNRTWVFKSSTTNILNEAIKFVTGRIGTLIIEEIILWAGIDALHLDSMIVKVTGQVAVVIGNYIISKWLVFTRTGEGPVS